MKIAIIYNKDFSNVINSFGMQNKEIYNERTVNNVAKALESYGHNVEIIDGNMNVIDSLKSFMPKVLDGERMGMVFNMAYGIQGESRYTHIPAMLEMLGIPYVGSNPSGHALALDKVITKVIMQQQNIPTPKFWVYSSHDEDMSNVEYPVIVKPKMESVSFGLKVVDNEQDLKEAVKFIIDEFQQQALVEQFIRGREFAVGVIGNSPTEAFPVLEIDLENNPDAIQSVEDKKHKPRQKICPANLPEKLAVQMQEESIKAFKALQLKDFARIDIRMDENDNFYILEINSMASLGASGSYPFAAKAAGLSYDALVNKMLEVAAKRNFADKYDADETEAAKSISSINRKIKSFLRNKQIRYEELLKSLINTNTHVRNVEGVNKLLSIIRKYFIELGFSYQIIPQAELGNIHFYSNTESEEHDILLIANIDNGVKIEKHQYFTETEQKIFGTGAWQNKGGLVVLIAALQALKSIKMLSKRKIGVLLTTDSAIKNKVSASIIKQKSATAKYVFGLTGAFLDGGIVTSRSGTATYDISLNLIDYATETNVSKAANIYTKLAAALINLSNQQQGILVTPSALNFSSNILNISAHGKISLSIRYNNIEQIKDIESKILNLIPKRYKNIMDIYISVGNKRPAMERSEKIDHLWQIFKSTANKLDVRLREEHRWHSADICFVSDNKYKIDGIGPVGEKNENEQEFILKYSLIEKSALLAMVINNLEQ
jgi:D-alanine-D-alanine ligase